MPRIVLDTNVLFDRPSLAALGESTDQLVLPAVAFAERVRQVVRRGGTVEEVWRLLKYVGVQVESFGADEALRRPAGDLDDKAWTRLARDAFIASHVGPGDVLWTRDVADFVAVGVPREQIQDIAALG